MAESLTRETDRALVRAVEGLVRELVTISREQLHVLRDLRDELAVIRSVKPDPSEST